MPWRVRCRTWVAPRWPAHPDPAETSGRPVRQGPRAIRGPPDHPARRDPLAPPVQSGLARPERQARTDPRAQQAHRVRLALPGPPVRRGSKARKENRARAASQALPASLGQPDRHAPPATLSSRLPTIPTRWSAAAQGPRPRSSPDRHLPASTPCAVSTGEPHCCRKKADSGCILWWTSTTNLECDHGR